MEGLRLGVTLGLVALPLAAWGSPRFARRIRAGQRIRPEGPVDHRAKAGTPTMGGIVPLLLILVGIGILWGAGEVPSPLGGFVLAATLAGALVGLLDDLRSQRRRASVGLVPHQTLVAQVLGGGLLCLLVPALELELLVPFSSLRLPLSALPVWGWAPLVLVGFVGTVNAVNLADGLDGLATGVWLLALLGLLPTTGAPALRAVIGVAVGAGGGFLWANAYPARVFLGNVGAMGLGGFLFGMAFVTGGVFLLPLVGGVFVVMALSVILQVGSYKLTGVRLFKMSPFHHHLEAGEVPWPYRIRSPGWAEPQVVVRLWILGAACALVGVLARSFG
ncbi:MAG: phospho-N-acetylmuramoyl-pentapeptide-transferase [Candidatus Bipolaricaulota bacterium]